MKYLIIILLLSFITLSACGNNQSFHSECINSACQQVQGKGVNNCSSNTDCVIPLGNTVFGLNAPFSTQEIVKQVIPEFNNLGVTKNRIWDDWGFREPTKNNYNWASTDTRIDNSVNNGISILLTIKPFSKTQGKTNWYCDTSTIINENSCVFTSEGDEQFKKYLEQITTRYSGKIDKIQFSNEWDSTYQYSGTAKDYVKYANWLYEITKKNSPTTTVVLGSITKTVPRYIATCKINLLDEYTSLEGDSISGEELQKQFCDNEVLIEKYDRVKYVFENAKYDMADLHLYDDSENWDEYLTAIKTLTDKKIIVSEFGGPNNFNKKYDASNEQFQAQELNKYLTKIIELNIPEAYYFRLVENHETSAPHHIYTGIIKMVNGKPVRKPNYEVFKKFTNK